MDSDRFPLEHWVHREHFLHFTKEVNCSVCLTASLDVTGLSRRCGETGRKFYICILYCISRVLNAHEEFRLQYNGRTEEVSCWREIHPAHLVFHPENETFTGIYSRWDKDFLRFYDGCAADLLAGQSLSGYRAPGIPENVFDASYLPWISYDAMNLMLPQDHVYLGPIITWGRYRETQGQRLLPLTMQIHHGAADGFHVARFFHEVQACADALAATLPPQ